MGACCTIIAAVDPITIAGQVATKQILEPIASRFLLFGREWVTEHINQKMHQLSSGTRETTLNETYIARGQVINRILTQKLDEIKQGIEVLRNKDFETAKSYYIEALRWRYQQNIFRDYIKKSYDKCIAAKSAIVDSKEKIYLYSLLISCGFVYHSNYGNNYIQGIQHIFNVLVDMNADSKLRKDLSTALGSTIYQNKSQETLLQSVIYFAVRCNLFITQIQRSIRWDVVRAYSTNYYISTEGEIEGATDVSQKGVTDGITNLKEYSYCKQYILHAIEHINSLYTHSITDIIYSYSGLEFGKTIYLNRYWIPTYYNGYYFGNIGCNSCKYSKIEPIQFYELIKNMQEMEKAISQIMVITVQWQTSINQLVNYSPSDLEDRELELKQQLEYIAFIYDTNQQIHCSVHQVIFENYRAFGEWTFYYKHTSIQNFSFWFKFKYLFVS